MMVVQKYFFKALASLGYCMRFLFWTPFSIGIFILLYVGVAFSGDSWEKWQEKAGPIPVVNQSPIQLLFLEHMPDRADTLPRGRGCIRLNTALTNTLVSGKSEHYDATIDTEMVRTSLQLSYGVLPGLELGLSVPAIHYYSGAMDGFIEDVENLFGDSRNIRENQDTNRFVCFVKKDDKTIISASENSIGMGDVVLKAKAKVWDEGNILPALSIRSALKLPTGDKDQAFGSGEIDWGLGLLLQKDISKASLYFNANVTFPGDAFDDAGISLNEFYSYMIGVEYRFTPRFSALAQMNHTITRPFTNTGLDLLDRRIHELLLGINYRVGEKVFIQAGGVEDIIDSCDATADITFFFNVGLIF